eukprot:NODE_5139_length_1804_cov_5.318426.p1 GENE.NODE_5139_length_1804_cov_5.318426~~NODE_5139_length_1804_cov_5.318426.p1  ORF type:complete len:458 (-),score=102.04 NODE_5139_length_1804_cov_5.318426:431-1723(-)
MKGAVLRRPIPARLRRPARSRPGPRRTPFTRDISVRRNSDHWLVVRGPRNNMTLADELNQWATTRSGEAKLQRYVAASWTTGRVMLLFAPSKSSFFCGAAEVMGFPGAEPATGPQPPWQTDGVVIGLAFNLLWEVRPSEKREVPFRELRGLPDTMLKDMTRLGQECALGVLRRLRGHSPGCDRSGGSGGEDQRQRRASLPPRLSPMARRTLRRTADRFRVRRRRSPWPANGLPPRVEARPFEGRAALREPMGRGSAQGRRRSPLASRADVAQEDARDQRSCHRSRSPRGLHAALHAAESNGKEAPTRQSSVRLCAASHPTERDDEERRRHVHVRPRRNHSPGRAALHAAPCGDHRGRSGPPHDRRPHPAARLRPGSHQPAPAGLPPPRGSSGMGSGSVGGSSGRQQHPRSRRRPLPARSASPARRRCRQG